MPGSKSNVLELELLDHWLGNSAYTAPANVFFALFTVAPTDAGGGTEVTGGSYARVSVANNLTNFPSANPKSNAGAITWPTATAGWGDIVAVGVFDALTVGNLLDWGWLGSDDGRIFTGLNTGDVLTVPGHTLVNTDQVRLLAVPGSILPTGLSEGQTYFVISVSGNTLQLSLTSGGAAVVITVDGSGLIAKITPKPVLVDDVVSIAIGQFQHTED